MNHSQPRSFGPLVAAVAATFSLSLGAPGLAAADNAVVVSPDYVNCGDGNVGEGRGRASYIDQPPVEVLYQVLDTRDPRSGETGVDVSYQVIARDRTSVVMYGRVVGTNEIVYHQQGSAQYDTSGRRIGGAEHTTCRVLPSAGLPR